MELKEIYRDGETWRIRLADGKPYAEDGKPYGSASREAVKRKWQELLLQPEGKGVTDGAK